ncbi:unnamed protein product [Calypogeia fissa]
MSNWVGNPLKPESQFAAAGLLEKPLIYHTVRPKTVVRIVCSSPSPESPFSSQRVAVNDVQRQKASSAVEQPQKIGSNRGRSSNTTTRVASISSPGFPTFPDDASQDAYVKRTQNGAAISGRSVEVSAKGKWQKRHESSLSEDEPLPLPMTWPNSTPIPPEKVNELLKCDPEKQTCKDVIYQWTGDCKRCQGTGLVSFYRKKREIISKCINCLGIGSVHKITSRADIQDMDGLKGNSSGSMGNSNGSARGSPGTNWKA